MLLLHIFIFIFTFFHVHDLYIHSFFCLWIDRLISKSSCNQIFIFMCLFIHSFVLGFNCLVMYLSRFTAGDMRWMGCHGDNGSAWWSGW